jgi:hypothetical protein
MALRALAAALASLTLVPAAAQGSTRPHFPKTVAGTISGAYLAKTDGSTYKASWSIAGARFKLVHIRSVEGSWTGFYVVTAGSVTYSESKSGPCSYELSEKFALKPAMPSSRVSTPLALTRSLTGHDTYGGMIQPKKHWTVTETCTFPDQEPSTDQVRIDARNLFDTGSKSGKIGRAMKGRFVYKDDFNNSTKAYRWSLRPRR